MTTFFWTYDGNNVSIVGTFNDWQPQPLSKGPRGFHITIDLPAGSYEYKFIVDGRRWCYDVLRPTVTDERGNRNNTITIGGEKGKKGPKQEPKVQHKREEPVAVQADEEPVVVQPDEEEPVAVQPVEEAPVAQQQKGKKGKGGGQQQQQQQQGKGKGGAQQQQKGKKVSAAARTQAQTIIKTVKSYQAPFYVGDVDLETLEDVLSCAEVFQSALPDFGCMFLCGSVTSFIVAAVVPADKASVLTAKEWVSTAMTCVAQPPEVNGTDTFAHALLPADPDNGIFPIKLKDLCRGPTFVLLRKKGLVKEEESDDEMFFLDE